MAMWNPWRGYHKYSEDWRFCYIRMKSGEMVYLSFSLDFLLPDADQWRGESDRNARPLDYA